MKKYCFTALAVSVLALVVAIISSCGSREAEYELIISEHGVLTGISAAEAGELNIVIPEGVTSVYSGVFENNKRLVSVVLPEGFEEVHPLMFDGCENLRSVTLPEGIKAIGKNAFRGCYSLTEINFPDSLENVYAAAFKGCLGLIEYEDGVYYVNNWAVDCNRYVLNVTLREGTRGVAAGAFVGYWNLRTVTLPDSVAYIGNGSFTSCMAMERLELGNGLVRIGEAAIVGCNRLTELCLPDTLEYIGVNAISNNVRLKELELPDGVKYVANIGVAGLVTEQDGVEYVHGWAVGRGRHFSIAEPLVIGEGTVGISDNAFYTVGITELILPDSLTYIGENAFSGNKLVSLTIPANVTYVANDAFTNSFKLEEVILAEGRERLWSGFSSLFTSARLRTLVLPSTLTVIESYSLRALTNVTEVRFAAVHDWVVDNEEQTVLKGEVLSTHDGLREAIYKYGEYDWVRADEKAGE